MKLLAILILSCLVGSCTFSQRDNERNGAQTDSASHYDPKSELTQGQQSAFDALNELQISSDERNRLYSTYPNISQPFYPADTSFEISQSELRSFMDVFISRHYQNLTPEVRIQLANASVLAQNQYTVLHCKEKGSNENYAKGLPTTGTWVMPNVLGRRDVILAWSENLNSN